MTTKKAIEKPKTQTSMDMGKSVDQVLKERGTVHGSFIDNAVTSQAIKAVLKSSVNWNDLQPTQKEALEVIAAKMSRIVSGNPDEADHWRDIAGYATLQTKICEGQDV